MTRLVLGPVALQPDPRWADLLDSSYDAFRAEDGDAVRVEWLDGEPQAAAAVPDAAPLEVAREGRVYRARGPATSRHLRAALRWVLAEELGRLGGLLLHACAIEREGEADVFVGRSGAGKTTLGRNAGARMISEETVVVWPREDRFWCAGTPWWSDDGAPGRPEHLAIRRVGVLEKSSEDRWTPLPASAVASEVLAQAYAADDRTDGAVAARVLELLAHAETGRLSFTRGYRHAA